MKCLFVGDIHLKASNPVSRIDDYSGVCLEKLKWILEYCNSNNIKNVFCLGDVFDSYSTSFGFLNQVISLLKLYKDSGIVFKTIVGNHDIKYNRTDTLDMSSLGVLINTGLLSFLTEMTIGEYTLYGFNYGDSIPVAKQHEKSICVAHDFYEFPFCECLTADKVSMLDYNYYILGHDHRPYSTVCVNNSYIYRPGSLLRTSSDEYNKVRVPRVLQLDTESDEFEYIDVPCRPSSEVFRYVVEDISKSLGIDQFIESLSTSYDFSKTDIRKYVEQLNMPTEVYSVVVGYLDKAGV